MTATPHRLYLNENDIREISYNSLLKYNQRVDELSSEIEGPLKVTMPSDFQTMIYKEANGKAFDLPIKEIIDEIDFEKVIVYLFK